MQLLVILFALAIERLYRAGPRWHWQHYQRIWLLRGEAMWRRRHAEQSPEPWQEALWMLLPALAVLVIIALANHGLVEFVLSIVLLFMAINCQPQRALYRQYLQAANRGEQDLCDQYAQQAQQQLDAVPIEGMRSVLIWQHYQHYAAVVIFYLLFGIVGVVSYATVRETAILATRYPSQFQLNWSRVLWVLDWVPARATAAGLLLVGHFSQALGVWTRLITQPQLGGHEILLQTAEAAMDPHEDDDNHSGRLTHAIELLKRNLLLLVCLVAILTLFGH
ncbi:hypothetical protein CWI84_07100 [Idiomarina tyrosinivorans]|uniref:Regulatory signaling modulator protein AmpE n=1 Tax=Idiomarina tyrosinivorans TaxID=1445662 RepID=A0A432ZQ89_9GAMM|nr:regulatory signaling modulator protein AmpE [Idiomarina tyrosinivorans]RUO80060.1 hypothetical protein CWI84_07100 [Idiomarina tyrosinivorans]